MEKVFSLVQKGVALISTILALTIFVPLGLILWVVVLIVSSAKFSLISTLSAFTLRPMDVSTLRSFRDSVGFVPNGVRIILINFKKMWEGTLDDDIGDGVVDKQVSLQALTIDIIIALILIALLIVAVLGHKLSYFSSITWSDFRSNLANGSRY